MRIDAHQHFWKYSPVRHTWINDDMKVLKRDFLPTDLVPLMQRSGFDGCVAVQADQSEGENDFLLDLAGKNSFIKGVVGWVDFRADNAGERLAYYAGFEKMKGMRHVVQDEPDDLFLLGDDFLRGIGKLQKYNLTYDVLIYHRHLKVAEQFVGKFPDQPFVLDHIAKPDIKGQVYEPWAADMKKIAQHENLMCKVSGMVTEAAWGNWKPGDYKKYLDCVFEAFGVDRIMIGSDWPVCLLSATYEGAVRIVKDYIAALSETEQDKVMGGNAEKFYGLT
ncbi:MAG: amidohydrolase family protein [Cyclobacteriaceae bacterium]|nr:amidohydrolase family protein [Cyclobacteriaceae bacterium]